MRRLTLAASVASLLGAALFIAGCQKGPGADELRKTLEARLSQNFGKGVFALRDLSRKGHYPLTPKEGKTRVLVYYNGRLEFLRDHRLSAWNQLNVGSLVSVLGATPLGIRGVQPTGNKKGDTLTIHGALAWVDAGSGRWQSVAFTPSKDGKRKRGPLGETLPYRKHTERLAKIGRSLAKARKAPALAAMTSELSTLVARSERRLGRALGWLTLATGRSGGEYHRQGKGLARILRRAKEQARAYPSAGSRENLQLVSRGEVLFGYAQNDIAALARAGKGDFQGGAMPRLRALCSLYPEALQIVTLAKAKLVELQDLAGKRIDIGPEGSGMRINARALLAAAQLPPERFAAVRGRGLPGALDDLRDGKVDAVFLTSAFPNEGVLRLTATHPVEIIAIPAQLREALRQTQPHLVPQRIPARTYRGMGAARETVGVTALLVARDDAPEKKVETLLRHLFANVATLSRGSLQAYFISQKTARRGLSLPLHPAAERFLAR